MIHSQHGFQAHILQAGVTRKRLADDLFLAGQLALIGHMLDLAAAADAEYRAWCVNPVWRTLLDLPDRGGDIFVLNAGDFRFNDLAGNSAFDENGLPSVIADAFAVNPQPLDRNDNAVAGAYLIGLLPFSD
ncbi:hypothetical protein D3C74_348560 [compost metagenome]